MVDNPGQETPSAQTRGREIGATALTVGGLAAAFGAASCCALPIGLGILGVGSAWLSDVATVAMPHQPILLRIALGSIGAGLFLAYWRPASVCATGSCSSWITRATKGGLWTASVLIGAAMVLG